MKFNKNKYKNCVNFLLDKNCQNILHSHSSFLNHLIGTFNVLKKWNQSEDLCFAGMFHNIYGNKYFNANLNVSREEIQNLIGKNAEKLVFKFTNMDRENLSKSKNKDLIILAVANDYDQNPLLKMVLTFNPRINRL
jgi:(p)ppGpp synthase/HD superfamily hydrolase